MFRPRKPQSSLFTSSMLLPDEKRERLERDWPGEFRRTILPMIDEEIFRDLYCQDNGSPNKPVQILVTTLILKEVRLKTLACNVKRALKYLVERARAAARAAAAELEGAPAAA